jgi:hypothetical protein
VGFLRVRAGRWPVRFSRLAALVCALTAIAIGSGATHTVPVAPLPVAATTSTPCPLQTAIAGQTLNPCALPAPGTALPCPTALPGAPCQQQSSPPSENYSSTTPPALPVSHNADARCTAPAPPPSPPDSWSQYGQMQTVDYSQIGAGYNATAVNNLDEVSNVFPLPFVVRIDPRDGCRALRITPDGTRIQRSTDYGATWQTVLDGSVMSQPPRFRQLFFAGATSNQPEVIYASETRNGDALVSSHDGGTTWQLAAGRSNGPANLVGEFVYAVTVSKQDPNIVYATALICPNHDPNRPQPPQPATACQSSYTAGGNASTGFSGSQNIGNVRLYVTRDGGADWARLADPNVDPVNGIPEDCASGLFYVASVSDPYSGTDASGQLLDHLWIIVSGGRSGAPCDVTNTTPVKMYQATWKETSYTVTSKPVPIASVTNASGGLSRPPFSVELLPSGQKRLISDNYRLGYSDNDGDSWHPLTAVNDYGSGATAADASGDLFALQENDFYMDDQDHPRFYQASFLQPNGTGAYDVRVGARLPGGTGGFSQYGPNAALYDHYRRALWDWPSANPLTPVAFGLPLLPTIWPSQSFVDTTRRETSM